MASLQSLTTHPELPWPEPLVIELIGEHLERQPITIATRRALARQHAAAIREMVGGHGASWCAARHELATHYAKLGIAVVTITAIDCAVFSELTHLAAERFRTSPRRRKVAAGIIKTAIDRLSALAGSSRQPLAA